MLNSAVGSYKIGLIVTWIILVGTHCSFHFMYIDCILVWLLNFVCYVTNKCAIHHSCHTNQNITKLNFELTNLSIIEFGFASTVHQLEADQDEGDQEWAVGAERVDREGVGCDHHSVQKLRDWTEGGNDSSQGGLG